MEDYFVDNEVAEYYGDERLLHLLRYNKRDEYSCVYCLEKANSREHLPSRIFLDEPYPSKLAILPSCVRCNNSFSSDEQYLACLIDYVQYKLEKLECVRRNKIKRTFQSRPHFEKEFEKATCYKDNGEVDYIEYDVEKIESIILKLAKGHAIYSLSEVNLGEPTIINFKFLTQLTQEELNTFNSAVFLNKVPEVGARGATYITVTDEGIPIEQWKVVQENQYRFLACHEFNRIWVSYW